MKKDYKYSKIKVPRFNEASGFYTTKKRSELMSKIRGKDTKPELLFRKALWALGYRYRINYNKLPGKPDIAITTHKVIIFIDGGFWHGYNWSEKKKKIKTNRDFWIPKIERNMQRDQEVNSMLWETGYFIFRFWDHELKKNFDECLYKVVEYLKIYEET